MLGGFICSLCQLNNQTKRSIMLIYYCEKPFRFDIVLWMRVKAASYQRGGKTRDQNKESFADLLSARLTLKAMHDTDLNRGRQFKTTSVLH